MATTSNLSAIIRYYAEKVKSPFIDFGEFCNYVKKYAEHHVEEQSELVKYLGDSASTITAELKGLEEKHLAALVPGQGNKKIIISLTFLTTKYTAKYKEIVANESIPYPLELDLPKKCPADIIERRSAENYIISSIENQNTKSPCLYILEFNRELPSILLPACIPVHILLETAQKKIRKALRKEEVHDYFLKKLRTSNSGKEISIQNFFKKFVDSNNSSFMDVSDGDEYYLWNQLCYFLRQDYEKIQDRTAEDTNVLQAVQISECHSSYLKQKFQNERKRDEALKYLDMNLSKPPYYYTLSQIMDFQDGAGRKLYGQYSDEDFKEFMRTKTTESVENELPELLIFKVASDNKYYIHKSKVITLVIRFCNEAHESIKNEIVDRWNKLLLDYTKVPAMTNDDKFEILLEKMVEEKSPILYSMLNAPFMTFLALGNNSSESIQNFQLFANGRLLPYSNLLMLKRDAVYSEAKSRLPFIYSMPLLSLLFGFFRNRKKDPAKIAKESKAVSNPFSDDTDIGEVASAAKQPQSRSQALAQQAKIVAKAFVPEGSTIDRELNFLTKQWNKMLSKEAYMNLTEDVNSLIRDYTRKVCRTISASSFTKERIENLAETLVKTPNMQKIGQEKELKEYVCLYMIRLVGNSK